MRFKMLSRQQILNRLHSHLLLFQWECGWYFTQQERVASMDANWLIQNKYIILLSQNTIWPILGQYGKTHLCPTQDIERLQSFKNRKIIERNKK
jgi:hypothetical protein